MLHCRAVAILTRIHVQRKGVAGRLRVRGSMRRERDAAAGGGGPESGRHPSPPQLPPPNFQCSPVPAPNDCHHTAGLRSSSSRAHRVCSMAWPVRSAAAQQRYAWPPRPKSSDWPPKARCREKRWAGVQLGGINSSHKPGPAKLNSTRSCGKKRRRRQRQPQPLSRVYIPSTCIRCHSSPAAHP